jgi:adhesin/invasin
MVLIVTASVASITLASGTEALSITVLDQYNNPIPNATVTATSSATGVATVTGSATTDASGVAALTVTAVAGGSATVDAVCSGVFATPVSVLVGAQGTSLILGGRRRRRR